MWQLWGRSGLEHRSLHSWSSAVSFSNQSTWVLFLWGFCWYTLLQNPLVLRWKPSLLTEPSASGGHVLTVLIFKDAAQIPVPPWAYQSGLSFFPLPSSARMTTQFFFSSCTVIWEFTGYPVWMFPLFHHWTPILWWTLPSQLSLASSPFIPFSLPNFLGILFSTPTSPWLGFPSPHPGFPLTGLD